MEVTLQVGQTLWDVALSVKGSWEAGIDMARSRGLSMTDILRAGEVFSVPTRTYDRALERYTLTHRLQPATAGNAHPEELRIFSSAFSEAFV